jgi:hypothetical protein
MGRRSPPVEISVRCLPLGGRALQPGRYANEKFNNCKRARGNMHAVNVECSFSLSLCNSLSRLRLFVRKKLISSHKSELFVSLLLARRFL